MSYQLKDIPMDDENSSSIDFSGSIPPEVKAEPHPSGGNSLPMTKRRRGCGFWSWFFLIVILALGVTFWIRYCNPYITDAQVRGYVQNVEKRGIIFKTFEGELFRKSALDDTTSVYSRDFNFSVDNDSLARVLQEYAGSRQQVTLDYRSYYGTLPWRGSSRNVVESVTPVYNDR